MSGVPSSSGLPAHLNVNHTTPSLPGGSRSATAAIAPHTSDLTHHGTPSARPVSATAASFGKGSPQPVNRPSSEVLSGQYKNPEAEAIDRWFEDLSYYEQTLEQMAKVKLDDNFREELKAIEQWFTVLTEAERTTALYSLLQHTSQVQVRFLTTVLQQMATKMEASAVGIPPSGAGGAGPLPSPGSKAKTIIPNKPAVSSGLSNSSTNLSMRNNREDAMTEEERLLSMLPLAPNSALRGSRRLYDRRSAPDDSYFSDSAESYGPSELASAPPKVIHSPIIRPRTPNDDAINSADWSMSPSATPKPNTGPLHLASTGPLGRPQSPAYVNAPPGLPGAMARPQSPFSGVMHSGAGNLIAAPSRGSSLGEELSGVPFRGSDPNLSRPRSPHIHGTASPSGMRHPADGWRHLEIDKLKPKNLSYAGSELSDYSDYGNEGSISNLSTGKGHKEKGKIPETIDISALEDVPGWLRSLRLHKYTPIFETMKWKDMVKLTDEQLADKGVHALGARRKMLKVFELVKQECREKNIVL